MMARHYRHPANEPQLQEQGWPKRCQLKQNNHIWGAVVEVAAVAVGEVEYETQ